MRASDVMTRDVVTARADTPVRDVVRVLVDRHITGLPVVDAAGAVIGVVSESDLIYEGRLLSPLSEAYWFDRQRFAEAQWKTVARTAGEIMTGPAVCVSEDETVENIATLMIERGIKRVPVVCRGHLVGIVTRADIIRSILEEPEPAQTHVLW